MRRRVTEVRAAHGLETPTRGPGPRQVASRALGTLLGLVTLVAPGTILAQELWTFTPSLRLDEKYTDNVFGTAHDRKSDFITRFTPAIALSYDTRLLLVTLSYAATGEIYADNSDLDNFGDNQTGSLALNYRPEDRLDLHIAGYYAKTNDPSQFLVPGVAPPGGVPPGTTPVPTVQTTRTETTQFTLVAGGDYHFTPRFTGSAAYAFADLKQAGQDDSQTHTGTLGGSYQLTPQDEGFSRVSVSYFDFDSDTSGTLLLGWSRQWTPDFTTSVAAGPRVTTGPHWGGAAEMSLTYLPQREWSVTLAYSLGTSLAVGTTGPQNVSALSAVIGYKPTRDLGFRAVGGWSRTWPLDGGPNTETTDAYTVGVSASYELTTWLSLTLDYRFIVENGTKSDTITTDEVILGLTAAYPIRK
jgi:hypothetical protein